MKVVKLQKVAAVKVKADVEAVAIKIVNHFFASTFIKVINYFLASFGSTPSVRSFLNCAPPLTVNQTNQSVFN